MQLQELEVGYILVHSYCCRATQQFRIREIANCMLPFTWLFLSFSKSEYSKAPVLIGLYGHIYTSNLPRPLCGGNTFHGETRRWRHKWTDGWMDGLANRKQMRVFAKGFVLPFGQHIHTCGQQGKIIKTIGISQEMKYIFMSYLYLLQRKSNSVHQSIEKTKLFA